MTGVSVGQSTIVPDNSTVEVSSGALQLKDNGVTLAKLAHGTANKFIGFDGTGVPAEINGGGEAWAHVETITFAAEGTKTSSAFTAAAEVLIIVRMLASAAGHMTFRFNGDSGNNYSACFYTAAAVGVQSNAASLLGPYLWTDRYVVSRLYMTGTPTSSYDAHGGYIPCQCGPATGTPTGVQYAGTASITSVSALPPAAQTLTGTMEIYTRGVHA